MNEQWSDILGSTGLEQLSKASEFYDDLLKKREEWSVRYKKNTDELSALEGKLFKTSDETARQKELQAEQASLDAEYEMIVNYQKKTGNLIDKYDDETLRKLNESKSISDRYRRQNINNAGKTSADIASEIISSRTAVSQAASEELNAVLSEGWKDLDHQYAVGAIASDRELYEEKKALLDKYGDSSLEDHWKYYEELYGYEKDFVKEEQRLEDERMEESRKRQKEDLKLREEAETKALEDRQDAQKKALSSVQKNLSEILSEYNKAYSDYESNVKSYKAKLLSVGDIFAFKSETDENGKTTNTYTVENLKKQMEEMRKYHAYVKKLKAEGASRGLIEELTSMDFEQGAQFGKFLAGMNSSDFADINELYRQRDELAQELAEDMYSDDLDNINAALKSSIYGALDGLPEQAQAAGKAMLEGILEGIDISSVDLSEYASAFSEGFSEMYENAIENMDLRSSFENAFSGIDTYSMGTDMAQQFTSGFNAELAKLTANVNAGQVNFGTAAVSENVSGNSKKAEEKITIENTVHTTVELDGNKVGETVTKYQNENIRRKGA